MSVLSGTVLVTGASGNTGRPLVEALVNRGASVRAMVRAQGDSARLAAGVEPAVADFDDPASLRAALEGTVAAYLVTPSSEKAEEQQRRFADLAARAGVGRLVVLSQLGADRESPVRFLRYHGAVEEHVRDLGIPHTFLRPNLFFQGLLAFAGPISTQNAFFAPIGEARVSAVDVRDIAAVGAVALTEDGHDGAAYPVTGPVSITHAEIAAALTTALGREITFVDVPPDSSRRAWRESCRPGRWRGCSRTTRTTGAGRRRSSPLPWPTSRAASPSTSSSSPATTQPPSPPPQAPADPIRRRPHHPSTPGGTFVYRRTSRGRFGVTLYKRPQAHSRQATGASSRPPQQATASTGGGSGSGSGCAAAAERPGRGRGGLTGLPASVEGGSGGSSSRRVFPAGAGFVLRNRFLRALSRRLGPGSGANGMVRP